jgi:hypothetical protein
LENNKVEELNYCQPERSRRRYTLNSETRSNPPFQRGLGGFELISLSGVKEEKKSKDQPSPKPWLSFKPINL